MSDVEKLDQTLLDCFAMLLLCLMVKIVELKEFCFVVQWRAHLFEDYGNRSRCCDGDVASRAVG